LFNLGIAEDGLYYYRADSSLLTDDEDEKSTSSYISYVTMEDVKLLFEALVKAGLGQTDWKITAQEGKVVIEKPAE
jgi:hypothetical protein